MNYILDDDALRLMAECFRMRSDSVIPPVAWIMGYQHERELMHRARELRNIVDFDINPREPRPKMLLYGLPVYCSAHHEGPPACVS